MIKPKVLLYDIEVTPNRLYAWPEGRKYDLRALKFDKRWEVLSVAWQWLGEKRIYVDTKQGEPNDKALLLRFREQLAQAHVAVTHNGKKSDAPRIRTRMSFHRIKSVLTPAMVDTCELARRHFSFDGNSLEDLAEFFGVGKKYPHKGPDMWFGCMADDPQAWAEMRRYNPRDVVLLKGVYEPLRPWIENHPNLAAIRRADEKAEKRLEKELEAAKTKKEKERAKVAHKNRLARYRCGCPECASLNVKCDGIRPTRDGVKQKMACKDCGFPYAVPMSAARKAFRGGR